MRRLLTGSWTAIGLGGMALALCVSCAPVGDGPLFDPNASTPPGTPKGITPPAPPGLPEVQPRPDKMPVPDASYKARIEATLEQVQNRDLMTTHSFWTVFHGILGNGLDCTIRNPKTNQTYNAVQYVCDGKELRGLRFLPSPNGVDVQIGPQFDGQGHADQFVAEMTQLGMKLDRNFKIDGKDYAFAQFLRATKANARVKPGSELTWTIVVVGQFDGTKCSWTNKYGDKLKYEDLVRFELNEPVELGACGGTHRLFGLTWALFLHMREGGKVEGLWAEVAQHLKKYETIAHDTQNPGGLFSTSYFQGRGNVADVSQRIATSGHILEWLSLWLSDEELKSPWMQEAALSVANLILENERFSLDGGALYHATHGLHLYYSRVYGGPSDPRLAPLPLPKRT
jgi:hypothetical protein